MERLPELELSVSATTRAPRPGEQDGVDYHFLAPRGVRAPRASGEFRRARRLRRAPLRHAAHASSSGRVRAGVPVVLEIEVQGARQVRARDARGGAGVHRAALARCAAHAPVGPRHRRQRGGRAPPRGRRAGARRPATSSPTSSSTTASRRRSSELAAIVEARAAGLSRPSGRRRRGGATARGPLH